MTRPPCRAVRLPTKIQGLHPNGPGCLWSVRLAPRRRPAPTAGRITLPDWQEPAGAEGARGGARGARPAVPGRHRTGSLAPDWPTGIALGIGGLAGAYTGARIQRHLPDTVIRRVMGVLVFAIGARYLWSGLG